MSLELQTISLSLLWNGKRHRFCKLQIEVKNKNGQWQVIEKPFTYFCGTGLPTILLPENQMVLTSVLIFQGDFETDLRLKIGDNYSEMFKGFIDLRQLQEEKNNDMPTTGIMHAFRDTQHTQTVSAT